MLNPAERILTLELVHKFQGRIHELKISEFIQIEDAAAKKLQRLLISAKIAEDGRKRWIGKPLFLQSLASLTDLSAVYLSKHGGYLSLRGLKTISDRTAKSLSKHRDTLHLDGVLQLTEISAEWLAKHKGYLGLSGLTKITVPIALKLSKHQGPLNLNGVTELSEPVAKTLAAHRGPLHLYGLTSVATAMLLSSLKSDLYLNPDLKLPAKR